MPSPTGLLLQQSDTSATPHFLNTTYGVTISVRNTHHEEVRSLATAWNIIDRASGVLSHEYDFNGKGGMATTFAMRMPDGTMAVISPPATAEDTTFSELLAFGDVGAVVAPNGFHHAGLPLWRERFPDARFFAHPLSAARIARKNPEAGTLEPLENLAPLLGERLFIREAPGTRVGETWAWAHTEQGNVWYTSDVIGNMDKYPRGFPLSILWRLTRSGPGYTINNLAVMALTRRKKALLKAMLEDVQAHPPDIVVPGHGPMLRQEDIAEQTQQLLERAV